MPATLVLLGAGQFRSDFVSLKSGWAAAIFGRYNGLRGLEDGTQASTAKAIDQVHNLPLLGALEVFERSRTGQCFRHVGSCLLRLWEGEWLVR
jgi:hypothetical protein